MNKVFIVANKTNKLHLYNVFQRTAVKFQRMDLITQNEILGRVFINE